MKSSNKFVLTLRDWLDVFMQRSMRDFILFTKEKGLSMSQIGALFQVHRRGACGVSDIGDELGVTSAAASQMIERLVQQELITRSEDPSDRRLKQIVLTDKGRQLMQESIQARQSWMDELVDVMTLEEQAQVTAALRLLIEKAQQLETREGPQDV